jgi:hypothetical protein
MWIITKTGFISVVQSRNDPDNLLVRARNPEHLAAGFPNFVEEIFEDKDADYRWRLEVPREIVADMLADAVDELDYDSHVKEEVSGADKDLYHAMLRMWNAHYDYQTDVVKRQVAASTQLRGVAHAGYEKTIGLPASDDEQVCPDCEADNVESFLEFDSMTGEWFCPACELEDIDDDDTIQSAPEDVKEAIVSAVKRIASDKPMFAFNRINDW